MVLVDAAAYAAHGDVTAAGWRDYDFVQLFYAVGGTTYMTPPVNTVQLIGALTLALWYVSKCGVDAGYQHHRRRRNQRDSIDWMQHGSGSDRHQHHDRDCLAELTMKIPFLNRPETRAGYTDAIVEALLKQATGSTTASVSSLGVTEACAGLWGRSFASATVTPSTPATSALTPAVLEIIGRRLLLYGEAVFEIVVEDGAVMLVEASNWEIEERGTWLYRADFATPEGVINRSLSADRVLHPRIGVSSKRP